jgi:hypothetical protein
MLALHSIAEGRSPSGGPLTAATAAPGVSGAALPPLPAYLQPPQLLKTVAAALDVAMRAPETFPQTVVAASLQQLEARDPLPPLFLRALIAALQAAPRLLPFAMDALSRLVGRQVWTDPVSWQGFLLCADKAAPASYPVLLQLPASVLDAALARLPHSHWAALARFALSEQCPVPVLAASRAVLSRFLDLAVHEQAKASLAAAAAAAARAKAEAERRAAAGEEEKEEEEEEEAAEAEEGAAAAAAAASAAAPGAPPPPEDLDAGVSYVVVFDDDDGGGDDRSEDASVEAMEEEDKDDEEMEMEV